VTRAQAVTVTPNKVAFYGLFGQQNWGNECTLQAMLFHVRRYLPDAELKCFCTGPPDTLRRHNIPAFPISRRYAGGYPPVSRHRRHPLVSLLRKIFLRIPLELLDWARAFRQLRGFQILVVPGTGLLTDFASNPLGGPYQLFKWSLIARLRRCKVFFVSVGAGPMYHPLTRWFIKAAISLATYRSYRDRYSKQFLENIGIRTENDLLYPDLAFSLPRTIFPASTSADDRPRPIIGVGVKDYVGLLGLPQRGGATKYRDFLVKLTAFVGWLLEHKYTIRLLIGDTLYDTRVKDDLLQSLSKLGWTPDDGRIINHPISSGDDVLAQLAETDIVVSARFHNVLLALMLYKPVVSLSYHEKFASLVAGVGLADYCHDIDHLDVDRLTTQIVELENRAEHLRPQIKQKVEEYREALEEQYARLFSSHSAPEVNDE
jgi:polysaccharide pyruvyl transferase WcaK-like protein